MQIIPEKSSATINSNRLFVRYYFRFLYFIPFYFDFFHLRQSLSLVLFAISGENQRFYVADPENTVNFPEQKKYGSSSKATFTPPSTDLPRFLPTSLPFLRLPGSTLHPPTLMNGEERATKPSKSHFQIMTAPNKLSLVTHATSVCPNKSDLRRTIHDQLFASDAISLSFPARISSLLTARSFQHLRAQSHS